MLELLLGILVIAACVAAVTIRSRLATVERSQHELSSLVQRLTARVFELESKGTAPVAAPEPPPFIPQRAAPVQEPASTIAETPVLDAEQPAAPAPRDWESLIGGNILSKFGALILVVGIGLFLAYSLTHLGPAAKVAIGLAVGISMLTAGSMLERRTDWSTFGRGFIGGGWAAVYFTTYAMHAFEASRVVESPALASILLLAVSVLLLLHSLRYRSQTVTGLACFVAFITLNLTPLSGFTVVASMALAGVLVFLAWRFGWHLIGVAAVALTYGTFGLVYEPAVFGRPGVFNGQAVLWTYWIIFESFDLFDLSRRGRSRGLVRLLFFLNAVGFLLASALHHWKMNETDWGVYFSLGAAAYSISALLRRQLLSPNQEDAPPVRLASGGYEGGAFFASAFACAAIIEFLSGVTASYALFALAELVVIAGVLTRDGFLRWLGHLLFLLPVVRLPLHTGSFLIAGHSFRDWTPLASLMAISFYINRLFERSGALYPLAGSALLVCVTWVELAPEWVAPFWAIGLMLLVYFSRVFPGRSGLESYRLQCWILAGLVAARILFGHLWIPGRDARVTSAAFSLALLFAAHFLLRSQNWIAPLSALTLASVLLAEIEAGLVTVAWGVEAIALVVVGFVLHDRSSRLSGLAGLLLCVARLFFHDLRALDTLARILSFIVLGVILLAASWVYTRYREQIRRYL